jgi:SAM-dependent methyltransferase
VKKNLTISSALAKIIPGVLLLLLFSKGEAQKMQMIKGHCGIFYKSMDDLHVQKDKELDFYDFRPGQTVASIGAQCCHWEAAYAACTDSISFYLEDIDTFYFKKKQADFAWNYYAGLRGRPMTCDYKMVIGNEKSTFLPEHSFDKIIIINSFHEFTFPAEMLADIKTKLKPGGILYIDEALPRRPGQLHSVCKKPMLTEEEMVALLAKNGYEYVDGIGLNYRKKKPVRKIFAFQEK